MTRRATWHSMALAVLVLAGCQAPPPSFSMLGPYNATQVAAPGTGSYGRTAPAVSQQGAGAYYSRPSASAGAPTTSGLVANQPSAASTTAAGPATTGDWRSATSAGLVNASASSVGSTGQVIPASAITPIQPAAGSLASATSAANSQGAGGATDSTGKEVVRIIERTDNAAPTPLTGSLTGGGMPVNDGTRGREPRLFSPPPGMIAISQWPAASAGAQAAPTTLSGNANNPSRDVRGLSGASGNYGVAQVSAEIPIAAGGSSVPMTPTLADSQPAASASTASSAPLGWKAKDGLK